MAVRLVGVDIPENKRLEVALTSIYGIGVSHSRKILKDNKISFDSKISDLSEEQLVKLRDYINSHFEIEGDLNRTVKLNIKRKIDIGCYQGIRHRKGMPVRGQKTKTNARTRKGRKKTVAGKKEATAKT
jgi:small subunit ribosomal protein S13